MPTAAPVVVVTTLVRACLLAVEATEMALAGVMAMAVLMAAMLQTPVLTSLTTPEFLEVLWEARVAVLMAHLKDLQAVVLVAPLAAQANL